MLNGVYTNTLVNNSNLITKRSFSRYLGNLLYLKIKSKYINFLFLKNKKYLTSVNNSFNNNISSVRFIKTYNTYFSNFSSYRYFFKTLVLNTLVYIKLNTKTSYTFINGRKSKITNLSFFFKKNFLSFFKKIVTQSRRNKNICKFLLRYNFSDNFKNLLTRNKNKLNYILYY